MNKISDKIFKSIFFVAMVVLLVSLALTLGVLYAYFGAQFNAGLANEAAYIAQGVSHEGADYFTDLPALNSRVTWIAPDGKVLYDNTTDAAALPNHSDRAEVLSALETGTGSATRYSDTYSRKTVYYALRVSDGSVVRVSNAQSALWALVLQMLQPILCIFALALVLSTIVAARLSKRVIRPLSELDLEHPERNETYDELAPLLSRLYYQNGVIQRQVKELEAKKASFRAMTEDMREGLLVIDGSGELLSCNAAAMEILGAPEAREGVNVLTLNRSQSFREAVTALLADERAETMLSIQGRRYQLIASPVPGAAGGALLLLDVTEKEERENMRREFTANVSHELKTPLTSISGAAELLRDGLVKPEDVSRFGRTIYDEAHRLVTLISDIIELSRLDEGGASLQKQRVELNELAQDVAERLADKARQAEVTLTLTGGPIAIEGARPVLEEMLYNLVDNAIKYNRPGGSVTVEVYESDGHAAFRVSDTGIGIPEESRDRVFERFYRVDKSHSKAIGGTGLGLSIVKHGAAYHNAAITLASKEGEGTTVTVTF